MAIGVSENEIHICRKAPSKVYTALNVNHDQAAGHHLAHEINDRDIKVVVQVIN